MTKEQRREYRRRRREEAKPAYDALMAYYPLTLNDLDGEIWRDIAGYDGYQVSNFGRVKSFKQGKPKIRKPMLNRDYLAIALSIEGRKKLCSIHILVAEAFIPNPDNKPEVNHDDGHKFNCHVSNLYWVTSAENKRHAVTNGLSKSGEDNYLSGVTNEQAKEIRDNPDNLTQDELAAMFGVKRQTISKIQRGKTYPNAGGPIRDKIDTRIPDEIRAAIRADWATGLYTKADLARKYGYSHTTICNILREG